MHDGAGAHGGLTAAEARVLGCLIEKESTTPDNYPLTLNSLRNACNQSTSRDPVVSYGDHEIEQALASLRERGLTRTVHSTSNRARKYRHVVPDVLELDPAELALLAVLLLRGAQTVGELKSRTERQHHFDSADDVAVALAALAERELVARLERQPGQKDARWTQLLAVGESPVAADRSVAADATDPADPYGAATAEFYDLLATGHWEVFGLQMLDLLAAADPSHGPIVDVGSGTGAGLPYLRAAVPAAAIHAVEPSRAMRTALHARLAADDELCRVTTVDPRPLASADLPARACAIVVSAVLGHLTDAERDLLWRYVADHLPAGAPAVVEVLPPERPGSVPPTRYRRIDVGRYAYEGWQEGEPEDEHHMRWTMTYKVLDGEHEVAVDRVQARWRCLGAADIRVEVAAHGLAVAEHDDCVVLTSRS